MSQKKKKVYLEIIRLIAIFLVLYEHTGERARWHFQIADNMGSYYVSLGMACINQMCVFLFFLISGIVLLQKEETLGQVFKKRIVPFIIVIAVFGAFQYFCNYLKNPDIGFEFDVYLKLIYGSNIITQYWFLRAYLGFLLILPLLRAMVKAMKKEHFYYFLGLYTVVNSVLPVFERLWEVGELKVDFPLFEAIIVFPILGYFLEHVLREELLTKKAVLIVNISGVLAYILYLTEAHINYQQFGTFINLNGCSLMMVVMLYTDIKLFCTKAKIPAWIEKVLLYLGGGVFGVYLFEPQVREWTLGIYEVLAPKITWFGAVFPWLFTAMLIGIVIMNIFKKIPLMNKLF